jgi:hypothetical protein
MDPCAHNVEQAVIIAIQRPALLATMIMLIINPLTNAIAIVISGTTETDLFVLHVSLAVITAILTNALLVTVPMLSLMPLISIAAYAK